MRGDDLVERAVTASEPLGRSRDMAPGLGQKRRHRPSNDGEVLDPAAGRSLLEGKVTGLQRHPFLDDELNDGL